MSHLKRMQYSKIYNHLADTYFSNKKPVRKAFYSSQTFYFSLIFVLILAASVAAFFHFTRSNSPENVISAKTKNTSIMANVLPLRFEYDFNDTSEQLKAVILDLPGFALSEYDVFQIALRGDPEAGYDSMIKVQFVSRRNEIRDYYIRGITGKWKTFKIPLDDLGAESFSDLARLGFIVEAWNSSKKAGKLYIDKIYLSKKLKGGDK